MAALTAAIGLLAAATPASAAYEFVSQWGSGGSGAGQFAQPHGVAISASGEVYVADSLNNRVQRFTAGGGFLGQWGGAGAADGQFQSAYGTAMMPGGDVVAGDRNNHRIQRFTAAGVFVSKFGSVGSGPGQLSHPSALATDGAGNVFVADYDNRRVVKFDSAGRFLTAWGTGGSGDGQFNLPDGIATDSTGNVYVIDGTNRVQKFSGTGQFILKWGSFGTADGQFNGMGGVASDGDTIFVSDFNNRRVQRFTTAGAFIERIGSGGTGPGQFNRPGALAATAGGDLYVADRFVHRILRFRETTAGALPPPRVAKTVNVRVVRGVVRVKVRGSRRFVRLRDPRQIPVGSTVDTLRGTVELTSAADGAGLTQTGQFYKGRFVVAQKRSRTPVTDLRLAGSGFRRCARGASASARAPKRRLWGKGTGRFRTVGRFATATVRGTTWLTEDRCTGTLVRATEGSVTVRDLRRRRTVVVVAPRSYFASASR